jgi:hypothetical protein
MYKVLTRKFEEYEIKNILFFSPPGVECKFTEVADAEV